MTLQENCSDLDIEYRKLQDLLNRTAKYWEGLNIDPALLKSYKQLLRYLHSLPQETVHEILGKGASKGHRVSKDPRPDLSEREIQEMPVEKILSLASNEEVSRKHLEQIASLRFGVTKGGLSALRNRQALVEKIRNLISNESTHESIARVAEWRKGQIGTAS